jgi:hypothetical protein
LRSPRHTPCRNNVIRGPPSTGSRLTAKPSCPRADHPSAEPCRPEDDHTDTAPSRPNCAPKQIVSVPALFHPRTLKRYPNDPDTKQCTKITITRPVVQGPLRRPRHTPCRTNVIRGPPSTGSRLTAKPSCPRADHISAEPCRPEDDHTDTAPTRPNCAPKPTLSVPALFHPRTLKRYPYDPDTKQCTKTTTTRRKDTRESREREQDNSAELRQRFVYVGAWHRKSHARAALELSKLGDSTSQNRSSVRTQTTTQQDRPTQNNPHKPQGRKKPNRSFKLKHEAEVPDYCEIPRLPSIDV